MSATPEMEALLAEWMEAVAPSRAPAGTIEAAIAATSRQRPRPAWLSVMRTEPMTSERRSLVGAPSVRRAYQLLLLLIAVLLVGGMAVAAGMVLPDGRTGAISNGQIAVSAGGDILLAEPDGSPRRTIGDRIADDSGPTFSPDGRHLAFWSRTGDESPRLSVVDPHGGQQREFEASPAWDFVPGIYGSSSNISWSPDSERLATLVKRGSETAIGMIDLVSGLAGIVDIDAVTVDTVAWSPDGEWLAYVGGWVDGAGPYLRRIHLVRPDGSDERRLTPLAPGPKGHWSIDWSPDSRRLTYARLRPDGAGPDIYAVDLSTATESLVAAAPPGVGYWGPRFSPDGSAIVASGVEDGVLSVFVMPVDGRAEAQAIAVPRPFDNEQVIWAPDGGSILVVSMDEGTVLIVPLDDPERTVGIPIGQSGGPRLPSWQGVRPSGGGR